MKAFLAACALVTTTSCRTIETRQVSSTPTPRAHVGSRAKMWEVRCEDELVGLVVLFQERGSTRDSVYIVRNPWHQDLGLIDGLGRAYRYLPHEEEPAWVGSGTIAVGAERILGTKCGCYLVESPGPDGNPDPGAGTPAEDREGSTSKAPENAHFAPPHNPSGVPSPDGGLPQSQ